MSTNVDLARRLHDLWNTGDMTAISDVYHPDFQAWWPRSSETPQRKGLDGVRYGINRIRTAFPDWTETIVDIFEADDRVVSRYVSTGTHSGAFWNIQPTGRQIEIDEISIYRIAGDRIVEQWCMCDELGRLKQLGVFDPTTLSS